MVLSEEESPSGFTSEEEENPISSLVPRTRANTAVDGAVGGVPIEASGGRTDIIVCRINFSMMIA